MSLALRKATTCIGLENSQDKKNLPSNVVAKVNANVNVGSMWGRIHLDASGR